RRVSEYPAGPLKEAAAREGFELVVTVPLMTKGRLLGILDLVSREPRELMREEINLLAGIGQQVGMAVENALLYEQAEEAAAAAERSRLARDLHDAVTQTLFSASLIADVLPQVWAQDPVQGRQQLEEVRLLTRGALAEMRTLLLELRPEALANAQMGDLLGQLGRALAGRTGVPVTVTVEGKIALPAAVQVALYRIAQEAVNNISRHAEATQVEVRYQVEPGRACLSIRDNGRGFAVDQVERDHFGLQNMRERAGAIGARLEIVSQPGAGTQIAVVWEESDASSETDPRPNC
ncbi:MAG: GAF domain-containing sensor histidine kinase, partial [Anaerolineae bacterium]